MMHFWAKEYIKCKILNSCPNRALRTGTKFDHFTKIVNFMYSGVNVFVLGRGQNGHIVLKHIMFKNLHLYITAF